MNTRQKKREERMARAAGETPVAEKPVVPVVEEEPVVEKEPVVEIKKKYKKKKNVKSANDTIVE